MSRAEQLWSPLLSHEQRATEWADCLYEVAITYFNTQQWQKALSVLQMLSSPSPSPFTLHSNPSP